MYNSFAKRSQTMCNECSRYSGETHSMGIMLLRSYHNSVSASYLHIEMWCRISSIIIYFHPFFVRLSFFFCFSVFLCVRWDVYRTIFCCCSKSKCVRNVYSLIETRTESEREKKWKFSQHLRWCLNGLSFKGWFRQ